MRLQLPASHGMWVAVMSATLTALGSTAMAQQGSMIPEARVQASGVVTQDLGRTPGGTVMVSTVTMRVRYTDLSLDTNSGQALFRARVTDAAKEACKRATADYPLAMYQTTNWECVKAAVKGAKPQVDTIIAAANGSRNAAPRFIPEAQPQAQPAR